MGFGVWEGLQWIDARSEIHLDGFSAREVAYESIFEHLPLFLNFPDKARSLLGMVLTVFLARSAKCRSYPLPGPNQTVAG